MCSSCQELSGRKNRPGILRSQFVISSFAGSWLEVAICDLKLLCFSTAGEMGLLVIHQLVQAEAARLKL